MFVRDRKFVKNCDFEDENSCLNASVRSSKLYYNGALFTTIGFVSNIFLILYYFRYVLMGSQILGFKQLECRITCFF